jgi:hypothetical protein
MLIGRIPERDPAEQMPIPVSGLPELMLVAG